MDLSSWDRADIEASFIIDPTTGPRGPITVSPSFLEGLKRIDSRLELRWVPRIGLYAVFLRFPYSNALWRSAVHTVETEDHKFRHPQECDLARIKQAKYMMETTGHEGFVAAMDKRLAIEQRTIAENKDRRMLEQSAELCKKYDVTAKDFGYADRHHVRPRKRTSKTADCFARATTHGSE